MADAQAACPAFRRRRHSDCRMCVSAAAVRERDMLVWQKFRHAGVPVTMLLSGGYSKQSASVISDSLADILQWEDGRKGGT